jgi:hypothetical protein
MSDKDMLKLHEDQLKLTQANYDLLKIMIDSNTKQINFIKKTILAILIVLFVYFAAELIVGIQ